MNYDDFNKIEFAVEATTDEGQALWAYYAKDSLYKYDVESPALSWEQRGGLILEIGKVGKFSVHMQCDLIIIEGHYILFYYICGRYADHSLMEPFLNKIFNGRTVEFTNAANFGHCIHG